MTLTMNNREIAFISILLTSVISGATGAITKIGLFEIPPISYAFVRFFLASLCILPFLFKRKDFAKDLMQLTPLSLLGSLNILFYVIGIKTTTATIGQLLYAGTPLIIGLIGYYLLKQSLTKREINGIVIGFIGVLIILLLPIIEKGVSFSGDFIGNLLILIGVVCFSFYTVYSKKALQQFSPLFVTGSFIIVTTLFLFPFFIFDISVHSGWWNSLTTSGILSMTYIIFIATLAAYALHQYAIRHGGSLFASMTYYLVPIFAYISALFLLGEQLTTGLVIGAILALTGIFFVTKK